MQESNILKENHQMAEHNHMFKTQGMHFSEVNI